QSLQSWLLTTTGHVRAMLPGTVLWCLTTVAGCGLGGWQFGPPGVAWGMVAGSAVFVTYNLWAMRQVLGVGPTALLGPYLRATALALPYGAAAWWCGQIHEPGGWAGLAAEMSGWALVYVATWWALALSRAERRDWVTRLR